MSELDEVVKEFLVESHENLDRLDVELVALEAQPGDRAILDGIFRTIHTIKGTCGFFGFSKLESVTHVGENLLSLLRDGALRTTAEITNVLLEMVDTVRQILGHIEQSGDEGPGDYSALIERVNGFIALADAAEGPAGDEGDLADDSEAAALLHGDRLGELLVQSGDVSIREVAEALAEQLAGDTRPVGELLVERGALEPAELDAALERQAESRAASALAESHVRVDVGLLDRLMTLVGELVLARNQVLQHTASRGDTTLVATSQRLNLITTELQEGVMKTRMQPIGNIWNKFPRVVRDLAVQCGKQVRLEMEGAETELDRTIVEAIKDPLTHILRNAVDHGLERPEVRRAAGKPAEGRLTLRAHHEGGQVNIEIADDGAGIDPQRIKERCLERGLITPEKAARLSDREAIDLIFLPGFSTAAAVTNISGRGVGMDVVRANVERIGGTVDIQSAPGRGTTVRMKIPLTLAIIPALVVTSHGERFAIPQANLAELVHVEGGAEALESIHGVPVYRLRGRLLPLVHLDRIFGLADGGGGATAGKGLLIAVLQADDRQFGLVVEDVKHTQEIVVKPLGRQLKGLTCFAGATIMGDGRVALILDVLGIAQQASVGAVAERAAEAGAAAEAARAAGGEGRQALLLFRMGAGRRMAIPLSQVARLEEFPRSIVEQAAGRDVVQYRDQVMPLIDLSTFVGGAPASAPDARADKLQVIVCGAGDRRLGLVVGSIDDVVEHAVRFERDGGADGVVVGSAVIQGKVTDLLDVDALLDQADDGGQRAAICA